MATKGKRPMRALTAGDKIEAIQRVNDGESKASVARDIGVPESTLRGWCKNEDKLRYMSTRHSTPDTDKSSDGTEPPDKRIRYDVSPPHSGGAACAPVCADLPPCVDYAAAASPPERGLDLSAATPLSTDLCDTSEQKPIELTKPKTERFGSEYAAGAGADPLPHNDFKAKVDTISAASISMSAISPLTGLNHLSSVTQSPLSMSFSDIATNLSLIAQLNPSLSALTNSIGSAGAKTLRSIRSPKPSHASHVSHAANAPLNLSDKYKSSKSHYDSYGERSRSKSHHAKEPPVDDALWYWLKTQQAMLDLTAHSAQLPQAMAQCAAQSRSPKDSSGGSPKPAAPIAPIAPINSHMDLNKNTWFWQYYKQFGGAMPFPDDKTRSAVPVPSDKSENILYSQLTKRKAQESAQCQTEERTSPPAVSPAAAAAAADKAATESSRSHSKARTVLDNLLFNNNNVTQWENGGEDTCCNAENEFDGAVSEALEHGDKFLAWLEACRDPSVTRMQVHQLRGLLSNIRARAQRKPQPVGPLAQDRISRRK